MSKRLPEIIEPLRLVERRELLQGELSLAKMKRLGSLLADVKRSESKGSETQGEVEIELQFGKDESGQANIKGKITAQLYLICQRCMEPMLDKVDSKVSLAIVHNDAQAENLPERYEPILLREADVSLTELVEDELILALPAVPMHAIDECPAGDQFLTQRDDSDSLNEDRTGTTSQTDRPNPFAVLEQLKTKK